MSTMLEVDSTEDFDLPKKAVEEKEDLPVTRYFFLAAVKVVYLREEKVKEKTVNILLDLEQANIVKQTLNEINQAAANRVVTEGNLPPDAVKEAVVLNIFPLAACSYNFFHDAVMQNETSTKPAYTDEAE